MDTVPTGFLTIPDQNDAAMNPAAQTVLLAVRTLLNMPSPGGTMGTTLSAAQRHVTDALRAKSQACLRVFNDPEIITPLLCYRSGVLPLEATIQGTLPHIIGQLHPHPPIVVEFPVETYLSATHAVYFSPAARAMMSDKTGIEVALDNGDRKSLESYDQTPRSWPLVDGFSWHKSTTIRFA